MLGHSPDPTAEGMLLTLDSQLILVGGQMNKRQCIHFAEMRAGTMVNVVIGHHN